LDAVQPAWKIISLLLGLGVFLGIGIMSMTAGDELIWSVGKAVGGFTASWIVLSYLGAFLGAIAEKPVEAFEEGEDGE
jgi:hypothetical protein